MNIEQKVRAEISVTNLFLQKKYNSKAIIDKLSQNII